MRTEVPPPRPPAITGEKCLLAAFALTAIIQGLIVVRTSVITRDGVLFIGYAQSLTVRPVEIMRGMDQHPGYPALILASHWAGARFLSHDAVQSWVVAALLVSGLCGLATVLLLWRFAKSVFDARVAAVAVFIFAALPLFRDNAATTMSDTPHLLFYLLAVCLALEGIVRRRFWWFPLAGAASGIAYWIRPEGLSVALVTAALLLFYVLTRTGRLFWLSCMAGVLVAAGAVALPYAALKGSLTAKKHVTILLSSRALAPNRSAAEIRAAAPDGTPQARIGIAGFLAQSPAGPGLKKPSVGLMFMKAALAIGNKLVQGLRHIFLLPLAVGLFAPGHRRAPAEWRVAVPALAGFHVMLLFVLFFIGGYLSERHTIPLVALAMPWIASGACYILETMAPFVPQHRAVGQRLGPEWSWVLLGFLLVIPMIPRSIRPLYGQWAPLVNAARWIRATASPGDAVLTNSTYVGFYANIRSEVIHEGSALPKLQGPDGRLAYRFAVFYTADQDFKREWLEKMSPFYETLHLDEGAGTPGEFTMLIAKPVQAPPP